MCVQCKYTTSRALPGCDSGGTGEAPCDTSLIFLCHHGMTPVTFAASRPQIEHHACCGLAMLALLML